MMTPEQDVRTIPLAAFDIDAAASVTGLSRNQLQRWDRNDFFHPSLAHPNRRRPFSRIYSYDDLVVLRTIAVLREARVSFAELESLISALAPNVNGSWSVRDLHVVRGRIFHSHDEAVSAVQEVDNRAELTTVDMAAIIAEVDQGIERLRERRPDQIGKVIRRRGLMRGAPVIAGTRIPTATVAWFHNQGRSLDWMLKEFPRLTPEDIRAAVNFESEEETKAPDPVLAYR